MDIEFLQHNLNQIQEQLSQLAPSNPAHVIYSNAELSDMLKVNKRTLLNWRNRGLISYSQIGSCIFYSLKDVIAFMDKHRVDSINSEAA